MICDSEGDPNAASSAPSGIPGVAAVVNDPLSFGGAQIPGFQPGGSNAALHASMICGFP